MIPVHIEGAEVNLTMVDQVLQQLLLKVYWEELECLLGYSASVFVD